MERRPAESSPRPGIPTLGADSIARLTGGLAYSLRLDPDNGFALEWRTGSVGTRGDLLPIRDFFDGRLVADQVQKVARHIARLRSGNPSEAWISYVGEDGNVCQVHDTALVEFDGAGAATRVVGVIREVAADLSSDLAQQERWRRLITENIDLGLASWDVDRRFVLANNQFRQLFAALGIECGQSTALVDFLQRLARSHELSIESTPEKWVEGTLFDSERGKTAEWLLADGRSIDVTWRTVEGGLVLRLEDTTTARNGERALRRAKQIAEDANSKKSRFLRAANHDLRQPLATLKILIFSGFDCGTDAERREIFRSMDVAVSVMDEILSSLLQVGQLDAERIVVHKFHFQASQILERLRLEFTPLAKQKGLDLRVVNSYATLEADRMLLERILGNFVANAIRFTDEGGILVGLRRHGSNVEIQVWDTGCGIPSEQFHLIFEEFHQINSKSSGPQKGLGLGLNIAQRLAELMGHELRVTSALGRGSMFSVQVPKGNIWQSRVGDPEISERLAGEFIGVSVMLIEDNENLRVAVEALLARWGVEVLALRDGDAALDALSSKQFFPDLILVDYSLPNGTPGTEVLEQLRKKLDRDVPGIVCTADTESGLLNQIRASGVPLLIKPISPPRLRSVMHHLLYERADQRSMQQRAESDE